MRQKEPFSFESNSAPGDQGTPMSTPNPTTARPAPNASATPQVPLYPPYAGPMSVGPYPPQNDEDEIDLVDLFVVLIKQRRLVVGLPLLTALVAGIVLFLLPALGVLSFQTYTLQAVVASVQIPPALRDQVGMDIPGLTVAYGTEFNTVIDAVVKNKLKTDNLPLDPTNIRFRTYVAKTFIGKDYKVMVVKEGIRFEVKSRDKEAARAFLSDMLQRVDVRLRTEISNRSSVIYEAMEALWKDVSTSMVLSDATKALIVSSRIYRTGTMPILVPVSEPEVFLEQQRRSITLIMAVVAAFFIAVFLAFIVEYVHKLKRDPAAMEKIRGAWRHRR